MWTTIPFSPCYIFENELETYGLPTPDVQSDIMMMIQMASSLIDIECGRVDGDGNGSLVYTTYSQRLILQTRNRNIVVAPIKPLAVICPETVAELAASGSVSGSDFNPYYTGCLANTVPGPVGISAFIGASGRYGYTRTDMSISYPDLFSVINPLNLVTMFGGPAPWVPMSIGNLDYDKQTGEVWIPAGLQLQRYSEVVFVYNSGYDPRRMPRAIKHVCCALVKNALAKGAGTTGLTSLMVQGSANVGMLQQLMDPTLDVMLGPYKNVMAY